MMSLNTLLDQSRFAVLRRIYESWVIV